MSVFYRFAVCSENGKLIDQHFGKTEHFYIYDYQDGDISAVEIRDVEQRDNELQEKSERVKMITDCDCVLCDKVGIHLSSLLEENAIRVFIMYNYIDKGIKEAAEKLEEEV